MDFLQKEYTKYHSNNKSWKNGLFAAVLVLLLFILFQPFGFGDKNIALKIYLYPSYSFLTFLYTISGFYLIRKILLKKKKWMVINEAVYLVISLVPFTFMVHVLSYWITEDMPFNFYWYLKLFYHVFSLFLVIASIEFLFYFNKSFIQRIEKLSAHNQVITQKIDGEINAKKREKISFLLENETVDINRNKVLLIQSSGNYLEFYLLGDGDKIKKLVKRGRLHQAENDIEGYSEFFKCHRAYIVNLRFVEKIKGNSKNARVIFNINLKEIPVSRTAFKNLREKLDKITTN